MKFIKKCKSIFCKDKEASILAFFTKIDIYDKIFYIFVVLFSFFAFYQLGNMTFNNDAHFWYERTYNFVDSIKTADFEDTFQNPKPGVTVMWLSGFGIETFLQLYNKFFGFRPFLYTYDTFPYIHFAARAPLVFLSIYTLFATYYFTAKYYDKKTALLAASFLGFNNFFIALTRLFHADSTLALFMPVAAFFAIHYFVSDNDKLLYASGVFTGFAILTKLSAIFLVPYFILLSIMKFFCGKKIGTKELIQHFGKWTLVILLTMFIVFPALWVAPIHTFAGMYKEIFSLTSQGRDGINPFGYYFTILHSYFGPVFVPFVFSGLIYVFGHFVGLDITERKFKIFMKKKSKTKVYVGLALGFYFVFYLLQMSLASQKMPRYLSPLLPVGAILAAVAIKYFVDYFSKNIFKKYKHFSSIAVALFIVLNFVTVVTFFPHYSLSLTKKGRDSFDCTLCASVGTYINSKETTPEFTVIVDTPNPQRFKPFIKGMYYGVNEFYSPEVELESIDYIISEPSKPIRKDFVDMGCTNTAGIGFKNTIYWNVSQCK